MGAKRVGFHGDIDGAIGKLCLHICVCVCAFTPVHAF